MVIFGEGKISFLLSVDKQYFSYLSELKKEKISSLCNFFDTFVRLMHESGRQAPDCFTKNNYKRLKRYNNEKDDFIISDDVDDDARRNSHIQNCYKVFHLLSPILYHSLMHRSCACCSRRRASGSSRQPSARPSTTA